MTPGKRKTQRIGYAHPRLYRRGSGGVDKSGPQPVAGEGKGVSWINAISTGLSALIAIPALILALLAYFDTQSDKNEGDAKEAAQVSWYLQYDRKGGVQRLVLENRSLRPVYDAAVAFGGVEGGDIEQVFYVDGTNSPCTRTVYEFTKDQKNVIDLDLAGHLYFRDSLKSWWRTSYGGGLVNLTEEKRSLNVDEIREADALAELSIEPRYEDLAGCG